MPAKKKAVAKKAKSEIAVVDFMQDAGKGIENADKDSFAVPFILCLQGLSPQLETVEGARPGKFINSVTNEVMDVVRVVPVYFERQFLRWVDRDAGGGFKGAYSAADVEEMLASGEAIRSDDGIQIRVGDAEGLGDTRQHYVLAEDSSGVWAPAVLACSSTQIKKSKNWITQINNFKAPTQDGQMITPPSWSRIFIVDSQKESNNKGEWHGITITPFLKGDGSPFLTYEDQPDLYLQAKTFYEQIVAGRVTVEHETLDPDVNEDPEAF